MTLNLPALRKALEGATMPWKPFATMRTIMFRNKHDVELCNQAPDLAAEVLRLSDVEAENARLRGFIEEVIECNPDVHSGRMGGSGEDDRPDFIEHDWLLTLQDDARAALALSPAPTAPVEGE